MDNNPFIIKMPTQYTEEQVRQYLEMSAHFRDVASERGIIPTQLE